MSDIGHNSGTAGDRLKIFIERIERLQEEKKALQADIKDIFAEAKGSGFNLPVMREIIKIRKMDAADRDEWKTLLDLYRGAVGL